MICPVVQSLQVIQMDQLLVSAQTKLVIFDLFGTVVKYGVMHHPLPPGAQVGKR